MKHLLITMLMFSFVCTVFSQTQTTLQDFGRLADHTGSTPLEYHGSAVNGQYLYNAGDNKIYIYKMTDPKNPTFIKTILSLTSAQRVWAGENYIFVYTGNAIKIYDITDHENPVFKADYPAGSDLHKVSAKGNYMFVLYMMEMNVPKSGSFEIVDISNPASPQLKGTYKPNSYEGRSFYFSETANRVYVAHYDNATTQGYIRELDYTTPTNPTQIRELIIPGGPIEMSIKGTTLFILKDGGWQGPSKLEAYDLSVSPIAQLASLQISTERAWDMHVFENSISTSLLETNGFKDFTWNSTTKTFDAGQTLNIPNSSQLSWYMVNTQTNGSVVQNLKKISGGGYWLYFYYYVLEKYAQSLESETYGYYVRLVEKMIWVKVTDIKVTLSMGIDPMEAEANGCSVSPAVGAHEYNKDQSVNINATDNKDGGWIFDKWTGDVNGTNKQANIIMNNNKSVVGHFKELKLVVSGSKKEATCICDVNNAEAQMVTVSVTAYGDNWILSGLTLQASGSGNDATNLSEVNVKQGTNKLWSIGSFYLDNGSVTATFAQPIIIPEGQTLTFTINYTFFLTQTELEQRTTTIDFIVNGHANAKPQNYDSGPIVGSATGERQMGQVYNTAKNMFMKISDAIDDGSTQNGNEVILCPGTFWEGVYINKGITLRSDRGKETSMVSSSRSWQGTAIEVSSDNVTVRDLSIGHSSVNILADGSKNLIIDNCLIDGSSSKGIYLKSQNTAYIQNTIFRENNASKTTSAILLVDPINIHIRNNTFRNNYYGIIVAGTRAKTDIESNTFDSTRVGILLGGGINNRIVGNTFYNTAKQENFIAMTLEYGNSNTIQNNKIQDYVNGVGIYGIFSHGLTLEKNELYNCEKGFQLNSCKVFKLLSNYIYGGSTGVQLSYCVKFNLTGNKIVGTSKSVLESGYGIFLAGGNDDGYVYSNSLLQNCSGIKIAEDNKNIRLVLNIINNSFCFLTGVHLTHSENIKLIGNSFSGNHGAAIMSESSSGISVSSNNFISNDVGLINSNSNTGITADNNYWGGNAPGNSDYQGNVAINNWLSSPVKLQTTFDNQSREVYPGESDTLLLAIQNINDPNDQVQVTLVEDNNWISGSKTLTGTMTDSTGLVFKIPYSVPSATQNGVTNNIFATVVSTKNQGLAASDTIKLTTYTQSLQSLTLSPDSSTVSQGISYQFHYTAYDEKNKTINISPVWTTTAGTISANGSLETNGIQGEVKVTVSDPASGKSSSVKCYVTSVPEELKKIILNPSSVTLNYGNSKLFAATGYNQFGFKSEFPKVWSATAGTILQNGLYIANSSASSCVVTVSDTNHLVSATANVTIVGATGVEEPIKIPSDFSLSQNYPNPFNPLTKINYSLPYSSRVKISVYNVLGQLVTELIEEEKLAGNYTITWDAKTVASGIYFCRIVALNSQKNFVKTMKMALLK